MVQNNTNDILGATLVEIPYCLVPDLVLACLVSLDRVFGRGWVPTPKLSITSTLQ